jgi:hypothetical protein
LYEKKTNFILGVLLALFEQLGIIQAFQGKSNLSVGTVAAGKKDLVLIFKLHFMFDKGWQNFFVCIEMCLASVALRFAFPHQPYMLRENYLSTSSTTDSGQGTSNTGGRVVTMQSISNNLKETMNPKDIMHGKLFWSEMIELIV